MNTWRLKACLITTVFTAGCATQAPVETQSTLQDTSYTARYMAAVEHAAKRNRVLVYWVHPPEAASKRSVAEDKQD